MACKRATHVCESTSKPMRGTGPTRCPAPSSWGARRIAVAEELDRWLDPGHRYFKVRGDDGDIYILRYDAPSDCRELTLFSARGQGPRLSST